MCLIHITYLVSGGLYLPRTCNNYYNSSFKYPILCSIFNLSFFFYSIVHMYLIWTWFNGFDLLGVNDQIYKSLDEASLIQQLICVWVWFDGCDRFGLWPCMDKLRRSHFDPTTEMFGSLIRQLGLVWAPTRYVWAYIRLWSSGWDLF